MAQAITVHCPSCNTAFPVDPAKVPEGGVRARCSVCSDVFPVEASPGEPAAPDVEERVVGSGQDALETREPEPGEEDVVTGPEEEGVATGLQPDEEPATGDVEEGAPGFGFGGPPVREAPAAEEAEEPEQEGGMPVEEAPADAPPPEEASRPAFGQRTPEEKAQRLARVLVSDMITYNPQLYEKAVDRGTIEEDFEDEIQKSWEEYVEQVGEELASSTSYWTNALNDILAKGEKIF